MVVAHNMLAANTSRQLGIITDGKKKSTEKLSSGYRINRSADDAAGLAISEKMRYQVRGLNKASKNIQDGISLIQVADGALNETHAVLQRMRELSVQAANDTNTDADREAIQSEIDALTEEVDRIANDTNFNEGIYPLKGDEVSVAQTGTGTGGVQQGNQMGSINIPTSTITPRKASIVDSDYPTGSVTNIDTNSLSSYASYTDTDGRLHYILSAGKYSIDSAITNVVFDVSGNTAIESSSLKNISILCAQGTTLSVKNLEIDNFETDATIKGIGSAIEFQGSGNTLNCYGNNILVGGFNDYKVYTDSKDGTPYYISCAAVNVGDGDELTINGTDTSVLDAKSPCDQSYSFSYDNASGVCRAWAIGSNFHEDGGNITINGGTILASGNQAGAAQNGFGGGGIGGGNNISVTINGGFISVDAGEFGIGGGYTFENGTYMFQPNGSGTVNITDGEIHGTSLSGYAVIGLHNGGDINISGGYIDAEGIEFQSVGIGGAFSSLVPNIDISGGYVFASSLGPKGCAIGGSVYGYLSDGNQTNSINISGGTVVAVSSDDTPAIGIPYLNPLVSTAPTYITVNNTLVDATGQDDGDGHHVYIYPDMYSGQGNSSNNGSGQNSANNGNGIQNGQTGILRHRLWIQMGAQKEQGMFLSLVDATAKGVGITDPALDISSFEKAGTSISRLDTAINRVSAYRSNFGAQQNRLEHAMAVDDATSENTQAAESRIRDTDMAEEMVNYSRHNILEQAGQSMLAQSNQNNQGILALLQ